MPTRKRRWLGFDDKYHSVSDIPRSLGKSKIEVPAGQPSVLKSADKAVEVLHEPEIFPTKKSNTQRTVDWFTRKITGSK